MTFVRFFHTMCGNNLQFLHFWINAWKTLLSILFIAIQCEYTLSLYLTNITVPSVVDIRETVSLSCTYNMGTHKLNSVKWYKDSREFYRYAPMMEQNTITFPLEGVNLADDHLSICNQYMCTIRLKNISMKTTGSYRCEVSGDAPEFKLIQETSNMTVAVLPQYDPIINGLGHTYAPNEFVIANCTSDISSLPVRLYWYINDKLVSTDYLMPEQETTIENDGFLLRYRTLEMRFFLDRKIDRNLKGKINLRCIARIDQLSDVTRESSAVIYVLDKDELRNQKLINYYWRSAAIKTHPTTIYLTYTLALVLLILSLK